LHFYVVLHCGYAGGMPVGCQWTGAGKEVEPGDWGMETWDVYTGDV